MYNSHSTRKLAIEIFKKSVVQTFKNSLTIQMQFTYTHVFDIIQTTTEIMFGTTFF